MGKGGDIKRGEAGYETEKKIYIYFLSLGRKASDKQIEVIFRIFQPGG
jgi:hypothetical protein